MAELEKVEQAGPGSILRLFRRRLWVMLPFALVPAAALAFSLAQEERYEASASVLFRGTGLEAGAPEREAATNLSLLSLDDVRRRVERRIGQDAVAQSVDVSQQGEANVLTITATDPDARVAASTANAFAREYVRLREQVDRAQLLRRRRALRRRLADLSPAERSLTPEGRRLQRELREAEFRASLPPRTNALQVDVADAPTSPSSPKPVQATVLGAAVGLLLAVAAAFLAERFDRRVRSSREMQAVFGRPVLTAIRESRALAKAGPATVALPPLEAEAFRVLRANLIYANRDSDIRSILITSPAPKDGKTTVAWNLASIAAGAGARVLLIEADLRRPSLGTELGVGDTEGLGEVLSGEADWRDVIREIVVDRLEDGASSSRMVVHVLFAGRHRSNPAPLLESDRMRDFLAQAERDYDLVVLDTPPMAVVADAIPLMSEVGGIVVVGRLANSKREAVEDLSERLAGLDVPTLGIVINSAEEQSAYGYGYRY